jgi:hypothetical protein
VKVILLNHVDQGRVTHQVVRVSQDIDLTTPGAWLNATNVKIFKSPLEVLKGFASNVPRVIQVIKKRVVLSVSHAP